MTYCCCISDVACQHNAGSGVASGRIGFAVALVAFVAYVTSMTPAWDGHMPGRHSLGAPCWYVSLPDILAFASGAFVAYFRDQGVMRRASKELLRSSLLACVIAMFLLHLHPLHPLHPLPPLHPCSRCGGDICQQGTPKEFLAGMCHGHTWLQS